MALHIDLGIKGEQMAADHLEGKGYQILSRNWRFQKAEVDIIARKGNLLVMVEVKTRTTSFFGDPADAVNQLKQTMMVQAAEAYLEQNNLDLEIRYDVISVVLNDAIENIQHIEEAFYPFSNQEGEP